MRGSEARWEHDCKLSFCLQAFRSALLASSRTQSLLKAKDGPSPYGERLSHSETLERLPEQEGRQLHTDGKARRASSLKETTEVAQRLFQTLPLQPLCMLRALSQKSSREITSKRSEGESGHFSSTLSEKNLVHNFIASHTSKDSPPCRG